MGIVPTTNGSSDELEEEMNPKKIHSRETYGNMIWAILQDIKELDEDIHSEIKIARGDIMTKRVCTVSGSREDIGI